MCKQRNLKRQQYTIFSLSFLVTLNLHCKKITRPPLSVRNIEINIMFYISSLFILHLNCAQLTYNIE